MSDEATPTSGDLVRNAVVRRLGPRGLLLLALLGSLPTLWWNWEKARALPGISHLVSYLERERVPRADPLRFSVAVAHLEDDVNQEHEKLIVRVLQEFEGIQVLAFDRTISLQGSVPEESVRDGHETARKYLRASNASVVIWGSVLGSGDHAKPYLFLTALSGEDRKSKPYPLQDSTAEFRLPSLFWEDLANVLRLLIATQEVKFLDEKGKYIADQLQPFIGRVRTLLNSAAGRPGWNADALTSTRIVLANALLLLGEQSGRNEPLNEAIAEYHVALELRTRERAPHDWAITQNNLGSALGVLGEREGGTARLEQAVEAFGAALQEVTQERSRFLWAAIQNNLGVALAKLGERKSDRARLEAAAAATNAALQVWTREDVPFGWACVQQNRGSMLLNLGAREGGIELLKQAIAAYRAALQERTRERAPLDWAAIQSALGVALTTWGQRESSSARLKEAVEAFRAALQEQTRERVPLDWAKTQSALGNALAMWGERESGTARLEQAVVAYRAALQEQTRERVPLDWAKTQNNLGNALMVLGEREGNVQRITQAIDAFEGALNVFTAAEAPYNVSLARNNLDRARATFVLVQGAACQAQAAVVN